MKRIIAIMLLLLLFTRCTAENFVFTVSEVLASVPAEGEYRYAQGGGTDGTYAYFAMAAKNQAEEKAVLYKYDLNTWELTAVSEPLPLGHANDITFDPVNNRLIISHCSMFQGRLCYVDPETLTYLGHGKSSLKNRAVEYLPDTGELLIASGFEFCFLNEKLKITRHFACGNGQYVSQGLCCDGTYIYDVRWDDENKTARIIVHDMDGNYIGDFPVAGAPGEPESIFRLEDGDFAINFYAPGMPVCRVKFTEEES